MMVPVYTVYPDDGLGEFLWVKEIDDGSTLVGSNFYSLMEKDIENPIMSKTLFREFCEWAEWYLSCSMNSNNGLLDIHWDEFNRQGLILAQKLKNELGQSAVVFYSRSFFDPSGDIQPIKLEVNNVDDNASYTELLFDRAKT